jgi:membrane protease YdiL (CAAX protease family)
MIVLALGAGVYEEFIFRVILVSGFLFFLKDILRLQAHLSAILAVISASLIFSLFHYLGSYGEVIEIRSFLIRFGAGMFLSLLFILRGYGITAYTHTLYDLLVILI